MNVNLCYISEKPDRNWNAALSVCFWNKLQKVYGKSPVRSSWFLPSYFQKRFVCRSIRISTEALLLTLSGLNATVKKIEHLLIIYDGFTNKWNANQSYSAGFLTMFWFFTVAERSIQLFIWQIFLLHQNIIKWKPFPAFLFK